MSDNKPEDGEIWQDPDGMLMGILADGEKCVILGSDEALIVKYLDPQDAPWKRVFAADGVYVGSGRIEFGDGRTKLTVEELAAARLAWRKRHQRYHERLRAAGLESGAPSSVPQDPRQPQVEVHVMEIGPDGIREVGLSDGPDGRKVPEAIRQMVAMATGQQYRPGDRPNRMG